jgi:two-component system LytT family response regulator
MEIKAIIVDDEYDNREVLKKLLRKVSKKLKVIGEASNVEEAHDLIYTQKPNLVFLDIQMPGGNGFSLLEKFDKMDFAVIFVTSYDNYVLDALRLSALDYILKPIDTKELENALLKFEAYIKEKEERELYIRNAIHNYNTKQLEHKIAVHVANQVILLNLRDITHFSGEGNYTQITTSNNETYSSAKTIADYEEMTENNVNFFRIGKSCIANINYITSYTKKEPCFITINRTFNFEVSRRKKQELLTILMKK